MERNSEESKRYIQVFLGTHCQTNLAEIGQRGN